MPLLCAFLWDGTRFQPLITTFLFDAEVYLLYSSLICHHFAVLKSPRHKRSTLRSGGDPEFGLVHCSVHFSTTFMCFSVAIFSSIEHGQLQGGIQFSYTGNTGPDSWGSLSPNFTLCRTGKSQSPVNILTDRVQVNKKLKPLIRLYGSANVTLVNNKYNVGMRYPDHAGGIMVDDKMYTLKQMHWHAPSEHRINGQRFAAELHLVHMAGDGSYTVVAILFRVGHPDPLVAMIQSKLNELANEVKLHEDAPITFGPFHPTEVRKKCHKYYRYVGSFSTPPCSENVIWHILGKIRSISREQVESLRAPLDTRCKSNARPCQEMNGRLVEEYEAGPVSSRN